MAEIARNKQKNIISLAVLQFIRGDAEGTQLMKHKSNKPISNKQSQ